MVDTQEDIERRVNDWWRGLGEISSNGRTPPLFDTDSTRPLLYRFNIVLQVLLERADT